MSQNAHRKKLLKNKLVIFVTYMCITNFNYSIISQIATIKKRIVTIIQIENVSQRQLLAFIWRFLCMKREESKV